MFPENLGPAGSVYDTHSKYSDKLFSVANGSWLHFDTAGIIPKNHNRK